MAVENPYRAGITLKLNAGTKADTGGMIVKSCSMGDMSYTANADKVMSTAGMLAAVLEFPLFRVERSQVSILEN